MKRLFPVALCLAASVAGAEPLSYKYSGGRTVTFPKGEISFADTVLRYEKGSEIAKAHAQEAASILGVPDYKSDRGYLTLGPEGRRADPRIGRDRQALIMSGAAILQALLRIWPTDRLSVADRGLREGLLYAQMSGDGVLEDGPY